MATIQDFQRLDIRVGVVRKAERLANARYTTHKLIIDFGNEIGMKTSGARVLRYSDDELIGKHVLGVVNLPARQIGSLTSEVLTLGVPDKDGECILISPDCSDDVVGGRLF